MNLPPEFFKCLISNSHPPFFAVEYAVQFFGFDRVYDDEFVNLGLLSNETCSHRIVQIVGQSRELFSWDFIHVGNFGVEDFPDLIRGFRSYPSSPVLSIRLDFRLLFKLLNPQHDVCPLGGFFWSICQGSRLQPKPFIKDSLF